MQSIIQGSGLGPVLYAVYSSDLKAIGKDTVLVKYADDTTLVYPDQTDVSFADEFSNIKEWSKQNRLTINISKTKEIVFHRPNPQRFHAPTPLQDVQQVPSCRLLGTVISSSLSVRDHVDYILTVSSQRLYLLNKLKHPGLNLKALTVIFQAIVVSPVSYVLPAWYGHLLQADVGRINALFRKAHRWQLTDPTFTVEELGADADIKLFKAIVGNPAHHLYQLLPAHRPTQYSL